MMIGKDILISFFKQQIGHFVSVFRLAKTCLLGDVTIYGCHPADMEYDPGHCRNSALVIVYEL